MRKSKNFTLPIKEDETCESGTKEDDPSVLSREEQAQLIVDREQRSNRDSQYLTNDDEEKCELYGYKKSFAKTFLSWIFVIISGGLLRLLFHWIPQLMIKATHIKCPLHEAETVLIVDRYKKYVKYYSKPVKTTYADKISYLENYSALKPGANFRGNDLKTTEVRDETLEETRKKYPEKIQENGMNRHTFQEHGKNVPESGKNIELTNQCEIENDSKVKKLIIPSIDGKEIEVSKFRWFRWKKLCYIWDDNSEVFYKLVGLDFEQSLADLHNHKGFSWKEQGRRRILYGNNEIHVPVTPIFKLLFLEALNPFYIFQVFSVNLWFFDEYYYYASVIVLTSVLSICSEIYQMHQNEKSLQDTLHSSGVANVIRENGESETIPSEYLVPGDVIIVPKQGGIMQCDVALLQGTAIVNESTLTGESLPVTKIPLPNRNDVLFKEKEHSRHVIFCGTQVIQTRFYGNERVTAVVMRTGFLTSKGSLVRSIMYPPPVDFKFQQDSYKFILFLVAVASIGFVYTVVNKYLQGVSARDIAMDSLDLITIVVPPALPMAMTVGILHALQRLKNYGIFCISPRSINISGVLDCFCFDKTGTLTEEGLDMKGAVKVETGPGGRGPIYLENLCSPKRLPQDHFLFGMACCHSITLINMKMVGDPLDLKMFESTEWSIEEPETEDTLKYDMIVPTIVKSPTKMDGQALIEIGIIRQFPFSSSLQRMSVITRQLMDQNFKLYCKGSPEMIASLSKPETLPRNFHEVLHGYTEKGFRVLALGWKEIALTYPKAQRIFREDIENELNFCGLMVFENRLKEETLPVINQLKNADIRCVMVTGDNILTASSVAQDCGLVEEKQEIITVKAFYSEEIDSYELVFSSNKNIDLNAPKEKIIEPNSTIIRMPENRNFCFATEGKSWSIISSKFPAFIPKLVVRGAIFARMSPDQKQQLIYSLQSVGYYVGMCGDGANDCGALKTAHAGISLSETEASVASPFTSKEPNISCVPKLIREGRSALVTSFGVFKYMATYSLTQFVSVMILYSIHSNLTDIQFLYIDLFLITIFAIFFGKTESYTGPLSPRPPSSSLISLAPICSILFHIMLVIGFQVFVFFYVVQQPWFVPFNATNDEETVGCHENYAVYSISQFQYIILALVFSKGPPYRKAFYTNFILTGSVIIMTIISVIITVTPPQFLIDALELVLPPPTANFFKWKLIFLSILNCILAIAIEYVVIDYILRRCIENSKIRKKLGVKNREYSVIENLLRNDQSFLSDPKRLQNTDHTWNKNKNSQTKWKCENWLFSKVTKGEILKKNYKSKL